MAGNRRIGLETSESRSALIESVEAVMREQGYGALSARRVADRAGLKHQLVYYYFQSMDELLLAAYRRYTGRIAERISEALRSPEPLHALWRVWSEPSHARLNLEFLALANHNAAVREHTVAFGEHIRRMTREHIAESSPAWLQACPQDLDPVALTLALGSIGTIIGLKSTIGHPGGYHEANAVIAWCLGKLEGYDASLTAPGTPES